jgi:uncharacterized membrane protein YdbT with pleckstrin-like domain
MALSVVRLKAAGDSESDEDEPVPTKRKRQVTPKVTPKRAPKRQKTAQKDASDGEESGEDRAALAMRVRRLGESVDELVRLTRDNRALLRRIADSK